MNEILVITDANNSQLLNLARRFAFQNGSQLTVAYTGKTRAAAKPQPVLISGAKNNLAASYDEGNLDDDLRDADTADFFLPVKTVDALGITERDLAAHIWKKGYDLVINGARQSHLDLQVLLNKLPCPLMLLPEGLTKLDVNRLVYLTDLRYCQQQVLTKVAKLKQDSLLIAHICQGGLPDLTPGYGKELFADMVSFCRVYEELFFSHIKERNIKNVVDTLVNTMHADMLVCQNRQYHFQQLVGDRVPQQLPSFITVPLLIFPC